MIETDIQKSLQAIRDWTYRNDGIEKDYIFKSFAEALQFINKVGSLAEKMNHHPDIINSYNKVKLRLTTHDVRTLTTKDFDLAQAIDSII